MRRTGKKWTEIEVRRLQCALAIGGAPEAERIFRGSRTRQALVNKIHRLGLLSDGLGSKVVGDRWVRTAEAAVIWSVAPSTAHKYFKSMPEVIRRGRFLLAPESAVMRIKEKRSQLPQALPRDYFTATEAAGILNLPETKLYDDVRRHRIPVKSFRYQRAGKYICIGYRQSDIMQIVWSNNRRVA